MRRLPSLLLSFAFVPAAVLAGPVVAKPAPAPHAVPASFQEIELEPALTAASLADGPRTIVATEQRSTEPFEALGVTWAPDPEVGELAVTARTRTHGRWTEWTALDEEAAATAGNGELDRSAGERAGTEPAWVGDSDGVQVRISVLSGKAPQDVTLTLIDPGSSDADAASSATLGSSIATAATTQPVIRSRAQWGADESIRGGSSIASTVHAVTIHHSASSNSYEPADVPGIIRSFYAYHVKSRGWSDIGYNVLVDKYGTAWEGRAGGLHRPVIGAHAGGFNTGTSGVSMIGTYESAAPTAPMLETVARVAAWKLSLHNRDAKGSVTLTSAGGTKHAAGTKVTLPRIFGHRDVSATSCPGTLGVNALPGLRERAATLIAAAPATPPPDPFGSFDSATASGEGAQVHGWAIDPDASDFTRVEISVDGKPALTIVADDPRPDVAAAYPDYSPNHGFSGIVALPRGSWSLCATARNQNDGSDRRLGCRTVDIGTASAPAPAPSPTPTPTPTVSPDPFGAIDVATAEGQAIRLKGWLIDPDASTFSSVQVRVDGGAPTTLLADKHLDFLVTAQPKYSPRHGFDGLVPAAPGTRQVCLTGLDQNQGSDLDMGCTTVTIAAPPPPPPPPAAPVQPVPADLPPSTGPVPAPPTRTIDDSCPTSAVPASAFRDIAGSVHAPAIACVVWWQVAGGVSSTSYAPSKAVTRAQMATFLARTIVQSGGTLPASPPDAFGDDNGSVHEKAINQLAAVDVSRGKGGGRYDPAGVVSRAQMASFLTHAWSYRTGRSMPLGADYFTDDNGNVHEASIGRAARAGFTSGISAGKYGPTVATDRAQMATFLARLLDLLVEAGDAKARG